MALRTIPNLETVAGAARRAQVSRQYIYRLIKDEKLSAFEVDGVILVRSSDIDAYIIQRSHKAS